MGEGKDLLAHPKVGELDMTVGGEHHVVRLEVAVDDALGEDWLGLN